MMSALVFRQDDVDFQYLEIVLALYLYLDVVQVDRHVFGNHFHQRALQRGQVVGGAAAVAFVRQNDLQALARNGGRFLAFAEDHIDEGHGLASEQALEEAYFFGFQETHRAVFAQETAHHVTVGFGGVAALQVNGRGAGVGRLQDGLRFRNHADQVDAQDFLHVVYRQHLTLVYARRRIAGDQQVLFYRFAAFDGAARLGRQNAQDAVGVTYRRHFRVGDHDGFVGKQQRQQRAFFDTGRRVAHDVLEAHVGHVFQDFFYAFFAQRVLVAGLRRRHHVQVVAVLVLDQRLVQRGFAVDHVDQVVYHAAFAAHDQVEVTQANVEVDHRSLVAAQGEAGCETGPGGGLAYAAFAGGNNNDFCHDDLPCFVVIRVIRQAPSSRGARFLDKSGWACPGCCRAALARWCGRRRQSIPARLPSLSRRCAPGYCRGHRPARGRASVRTHGCCRRRSARHPR